MNNKANGGLQHIPTGSALSLHSTRTSIIARGRRDAANAASNPHYKQAVADYNAGNFTEAATDFRLAAEQGHAESQYLLSTMYDEGQGVSLTLASATTQRTTSLKLSRGANARPTVTSPGRNTTSD
jgi:TPR repeat protein